MPQCLTTGAIRRIDLSPCLLLDRNRGDESFSSFSRLTCTALKERAPHAQAFVLVYRASARDRRTVPPQASAAWSCHKATSLLHDGGPAPASLSRMATAPRSSASRIGKAGEAQADACYDGVASTTGGRRWSAAVSKPLPAARSSLRVSSRGGGGAAAAWLCGTSSRGPGAS